MSMKVNKNGKEYPVGIIPQQLVDDVARLTSNTYTVPSTSTAIDSSNPTTFVAPTDGYLVVYSTNSDTQATIKLSDGSNQISAMVAQAWSSSLWDFKSLYLRKGMSVIISATGTHGHYRFVPFN